MATNYSSYFNKSKTPQTQPIPGTNQVQNSAGGFVFPLDDWGRLDRFLILGAEGSSYYATQEKLVRENAKAVESCIKADGERVVRTVVEISDSGRASKNDPCLFALAMCAKLGDESTRRAAYAALPRVARIGTHVFHFAEYVQAFGGWGRGLRTAVSRWYTDRSPEKLAHQLVKYQSRDGWSHRDLLRLSHPKAPTPEHNALFGWVTSGEIKDGTVGGNGIALVNAFEAAKKAETTLEIVKLITEYELPRECVPTQFLTDPDVWEALLPHMGLTAMIRNLANMTRCGLVAPLSKATRFVCDKVADRNGLKGARVHPIQILSALKTYSSGHGVRGQNTWVPVAQVEDALDSAFYLAFDAVEPANKRTLLALDISGSMDMGEIAGVPGLTPRDASAAMSLVTAATERDHHFIAFTCKSNSGYGFGQSTVDGIRQVSITPKDRLDTSLQKSRDLSRYMGGTDCTLPVLWALAHNVGVDTFVVYTDSETYANPELHPIQALRQYRQKTGIAAKLVVVGLLATPFTIADPSDGGCLDVVGFDAAAPQLINNFSRE